MVFLGLYLGKNQKGEDVKEGPIFGPLNFVSIYGGKTIVFVANNENEDPEEMVLEIKDGLVNYDGVHYSHISTRTEDEILDCSEWRKAPFDHKLTVEQPA
ncbi:MAG: hypothetical protein CSYNP_02845 [Syntrophus sp. SKADARSKE-3]|nr:hypothetical protein [Syntrophus sp. SKADARSKE-3]